MRVVLKDIESEREMEKWRKKAKGKKGLLSLEGGKELSSLAALVNENEEAEQQQSGDSTKYPRNVDSLKPQINKAHSNSITKNELTNRIHPFAFSCFSATSAKISNYRQPSTTNVFTSSEGLKDLTVEYNGIEISLAKLSSIVKEKLIDTGKVEPENIFRLFGYHGDKQATNLLQDGGDR
ncbi:hypothetical protein BJ508DRAFT_323088 [Ascobolus immersus RN42]|uniref:Uncharacterized protein n=1 Tax=Ascobolus immersus RN42 TaxID=1160509 RepID=A0A3N4IFG9_ASCIM|nr:hypothetical protein BJ508DRAFT_323088 [Ascobolus immersus RN42]